MPFIFDLRDRIPFFAFGGVCMNDFDVIAICLCMMPFDGILQQRGCLYFLFLFLAVLGLLALLGHFGFVRPRCWRVFALMNS